MKKIIIYILSFALLVVLIISTYVVGYVNGSDMANRQNGIDKLVSIGLYSKIIKIEDMERMRQVLLVGVEAGTDMIEDSKRKKSFPIDYYKRYMAWIDAGIDNWLETALKLKEEALKNLKTP